MTHDHGDGAQLLVALRSGSSTTRPRRRPVGRVRRTEEAEMRSVSTIITGIATVLVAIICLFPAARAEDEASTSASLAFFAFGTLLCFRLLKRCFDADERPR